MIGALILAAGRSTRMGRPKLTLPWKDDLTIIEHVVSVYQEGGVDLVMVVTGGARETVEAALSGHKVQFVYNPQHLSEGMISSVKAGLTELENTGVEATLITPADFPNVRVSTVKEILDMWVRFRPQIIAPSYQGRRGHPILLAREEWDGILSLGPKETLRSFLRDKKEVIHYLLVDDEGILRDIDSPEDYARILTEG